MPTPPRESIGGTKGHQLATLEFAQIQYNYIVNREAFRETEDFLELTDWEKVKIEEEIELQNESYACTLEILNSYE